MNFFRIIYSAFRLIPVSFFCKENKSFVVDTNSFKIDSLSIKIKTGIKLAYFFLYWLSKVHGQCRTWFEQEKPSKYSSSD